jgi:hypothetical protein
MCVWVGGLRDLVARFVRESRVRNYHHYTGLAVLLGGSDSPVVRISSTGAISVAAFVRGHLRHSRFNGPLVPYTGSFDGLRTLATRLAASPHSHVSVHSS